MRDAQALYSMDPVRGRLVPQLVELLKATRADRCALVWCDPPGDPVAHLVIDAGEDVPRVLFDAGLMARGRSEVIEGRVGTGRARPAKIVSYRLPGRHGHQWCLVLEGERKLNLGSDVGQVFYETYGLAICTLMRISSDSLLGQAEQPVTILSRAEEAEASGDYEVAIDLYEVARSACLAMGLAENGIRATWYHGRTLRKLGRLDEALESYEVAEGAARQMTDQSLAAAIMTGRATIYRLRGNIPLARTTYEDALDVSPPGALAIPLAYFGLMLAEQEVGSLAPAADYGWMAFDAYPVDNPDRLGTLVVLGNVLLDCGDLGAAEDAYELVLSANLKDTDILATATNGLAQVAAQRGDLGGYERARRRLESARGEVQVNVWTQILLCRAQDELMLGRADRAREAVEEAASLAEKHKLGRLIIEVDKRRAMLDNPEPTPQRPVVAGTNRVRGKLSELRNSLSA